MILLVAPSILAIACEYTYTLIIMSSSLFAGPCSLLLLLSSVPRHSCTCAIPSPLWSGILVEGRSTSTLQVAPRPASCPVLSCPVLPRLNFSRGCPTWSHFNIAEQSSLVFAHGCLRLGSRPVVVRGVLSVRSKEQRRDS